MKDSETASDTKNDKILPDSKGSGNFQKVLDGRKDPIRGLCDEIKGPTRAYQSTLVTFYRLRSEEAYRVPADLRSSLKKSEVYILVYHCRNRNVRIIHIGLEQ